MDEEYSFDPSWVVELYRERLPDDYPEKKTLLDNLKLCTKPINFCSCGCGSPYFIEPKTPQWKFRCNISAYKDHTQVILDIMDDWSIGSIEILDDMPCSLDDFTTILVD